MKWARLLVASLLIAAFAARADDQLPIPDIGYQKFTLDNGLTLIVHEDHKAPIVAVNIWYHVGAKNEKQGKTGFAHLFEHLMFTGSEHHNDDFQKPFDKVGATEQNGTTNSDRTNFFEDVPKTALDMALWMESDRMCCMNKVIDQERLDEQRGVVQNEKRQGENRPYGKVFNLIQKNTYPAGHPYDGTVIGSMEDLDAASLDDVHEWFDDYYGPNNAVLVVSGDMDTAEVKKKVEHYFGAIPPGPPVERQEVWVAKRHDSHRQVIQDRVPQARIYKVWNVPELTSPTYDRLQLFADVLGNGKNSRLYKSLVYDKQIATDVGVYAYGRELGSLIIAYATAKPGEDLGEVEKAMDAEMSKILDKGMKDKELERVKTGYFAGFIRGVERVGGFGGTSDVLAESETYDGTPDGYKKHLETIRSATPEQVLADGRQWLSDGVYTLEVHPFPDLKAEEENVDRSGIPYPDSQPKVSFPDFQRATLDNGLKLIVAPSHAVPVINFSLQLDAGYAADHGGKLGTAAMTLDMMDEGAGDLDALQISDRLDRLGANLSLGSSLDTSYAELSALKVNLDDSLDLFSKVVLDPTFPPKELERRRQQRLAGIQQEMSQPATMALRLFPPLLYGDDNAYGIPFTGSGTLDSVKAITRDDLVKFHDEWFKPNNATLIVAGDTTMDEVRPRIEKLFDGWKPGEVPEKHIGTPAQRDGSVVYVVNRPDSEQSMIIAGNVTPPYNSPDHMALAAANDVLGGSFTARLNMNLREDKHWAYGSYSILPDTRGPEPFFIYAPVQTDKTAESMAEIQSELDGITGDQPPTEDEVAKVKDQNTLTLPGRWETADAVAGSIDKIVRFNLDDDYWDEYPRRVRSLDVSEITRAADDYIHPKRLVWVVVGDWGKIRDSVEKLGLGDVHLVDEEGKPVGN